MKTSDAAVTQSVCQKWEPIQEPVEKNTVCMNCGQKHAKCEYSHQWESRGGQIACGRCGHLPTAKEIQVAEAILHLRESPETWRHRLYSSQARIAVGHEPEYRPVLHGRRGAAMDQRVCWTCDRLTAEPEELGAVARADGWRMWNGHGISYRQQSELRDIPAVPVLR